MSLHPDHLADLRRSGLTDETIAAAGISTVSEFELRKELGPIGAKLDSAYRIPYDDSFCRFKIFPPLDSQKYTQAAGSGCRLYVTPAALAVRTDPEVALYVVEGEKKALRLAQEGLAAVAIGGVWNWRNDGRAIDDFSRFDWCDRQTVIVPDSDTWTRDELKQAVFALGKELESRGAGAKVAVLKLPQTGDDKVGADDYLITHSLDDFLAETHIKLGHKVFGQMKAWWQEWIKEEKGSRAGTEYFQDVEPHTEEVNGAELFRDVRTFVSSYIVMSPEATLAVSLWVLLSWVLDAFYVSPVLYIWSPTKRCGKTRLLEVLSLLVRRPLAASNISAAAVFRAVDKFQPTLLVDEADTFLNGNDELRGVLNSSHYRPTAFVVRVVGEALEPKQFSTWCSKAIAGIGKLKADTLDDRSIKIPLKRKSKGDAVTKLRHQEACAKAEPLRHCLARWAIDNVEELGALADNIEVSAELDDRQQDNWRPMITIAHRVGVRDEAAKAAVVFGAEKEDEAAAIMLLEDLKSAFDKLGPELHSEEIIAFLHAREERPWPEWNRKRKDMGVTARQVAALLKPFEIVPKQVWKDGKNRRGYKREWFDETFSRYLSARSARTQEAEEVTHEKRSARTDSPDGGPLEPNSSETEGVTRNPSGLAVETRRQGGECACPCHADGLVWCGRCSASHTDEARPTKEIVREEEARP